MTGFNPSMGSRFAVLGKIFLRLSAFLPSEAGYKRPAGDCKQSRCRTCACGAGRSGSLELAQDEGIVEGEIPKGVVAPRRAAVARRHDGLEQEGASFDPERPEPRDILGGLPVHDLAVVERRLDQH